MPKILYIKWVDSKFQQGWSDMPDNEPVCIESVGFELANDKRAITVALNFSSSDSNYVSQTTTIPRGAIIKTKVLKEI